MPAFHLRSRSQRRHGLLWQHLVIQLTTRPRKDERLSLPGWLIYSGRFIHHPSAVGRLQDSESSPVKDRRSTAEPRNQPTNPWPWMSLKVTSAILNISRSRKNICSLNERSSEWVKALHSCLSCDAADRVLIARTVSCYVFITFF